MQATANQMKCSTCKIECRSFGYHRNGLRRFRCGSCKRTYTEPHRPRVETNPLGDLRMPLEKATLAIQLLIEGSSIRTAERVTGLHRDTICRLLSLAGERAEKIMGKWVRNVRPSDVECDEVWGYVGKKEGHKTIDEARNEGLGDTYCFVAIDRKTKLVITFALGKRNQTTTDVFIEGLRDALAPGHRFQITTDGFKPYVSAISTTLGHVVDYAQLVKVYCAATEGEGRYSPATVESVQVLPIIGNPDPSRICTSIVERQNLTVRMQVRRMTRLTNAFSKKWENHWAALCLHFVYYNFCKIHGSLRVTPAMQANLTDHIWTIGELFSATQL
jgi:IS1 family transposase/transposase-like protein